MPSLDVDPLLVWGIFTRLLGVTFLVSFLSLGPQTLPWGGRDGLLPVHLELSRMREDLGWKRFFYFPTLLWVSDGDRWLRTIPVLGAVCAALVVYGGPLSFWALLGCYVLYLSLDVVFRLAYPWECVLFEAGLFALFLGPTLPLPSLTATALPPPAIAWMYRLLVFRVVVGFGKFKFIGSTREDSGYLKGFLVNQPLPTALGWWGHQLPLWALKLSLVFMFLVELPIASLVLVPGPLGIVAGIAITALMIGIQLSGNFGFFNLVTIALCVPLLDFHTPASLRIASLVPGGDLATWIASVLLLVHTFGALLNFPLNMYCAHYWLHWPTLMRLPPILQLPIHFYRALHPLRWLHCYGVFPPKSMAPVRVVAVTEASWDGETWHELEYRWAATRPEHRPRFIAPHHVRWDQQLIYESYGTINHVLVFSVAGSGNPYHHSRYGDAECLLQRVLEGFRYADRYFKTPFPKEGPPKLARMRTFGLEPTTPAEKRATGKWWKREVIGPHLPARANNPIFWDDWLPEPDLWDWDNVIWRRRSRLSKMLDAAKRATRLDEFLASPEAAIDAADLDVVWNELVPMMQSLRRDWGALPETIDAVRARFSTPELRRLERAVARLAIAAGHRLEPLFFGKGANPPLPAPTYLHVAMLIHDAIGRGKDAYRSLFDDPRAACSLPMPTLESGMAFLALFRPEPLIFEGQKIRLMDMALLRQSEKDPTSDRARHEQGVESLAKKIWGVAYLTPMFRELFKSDWHNQGIPERYPLYEIDKSGEMQRVGRSGPAA